MADNDRTRKYETLDHIHELDIDPDYYQIYLIGREDAVPEMELGEPGVDYKMSNRFIKNLHYLSGRDSKRPILIHLKTCGGHVNEGMAIYDAILSAPNPVTMINYTHARSMSSIILQAANRRIMMPNSCFMFHGGDLEVGGTEKQVSSYMKFSKEFDDVMLSIYAERMKPTPGSKFHAWSYKRIKDWLVQEMNEKEDVYLNAQQTVEHGFADEIFTDYNVLTYTRQQKGIK